MSVANFYAIFKLYCPATGIFFTRVGELGMALHEMWEVSALLMGSLPYEEYFPCEAELALLEKKEPALFETLPIADVPLLHRLGHTWKS